MLYVSKIRDHNGDKHCVFYEHGKFNKPLIILQELKAVLLYERLKHLLTNNKEGN